MLMKDAEAIFGGRIVRQKCAINSNLKSFPNQSNFDQKCQLQPDFRRLIFVYGYGCSI